MEQSKTSAILPSPPHPPPSLTPLSFGALLGPMEKLNAAAPRQTHGELVEQEKEEEEEGGVAAWDIFGPCWAPGGAPCAPAPRQTQGKLVERWPFLGLIRYVRLLGPSWGSLGPSWG